MNHNKVAVKIRSDGANIRLETHYCTVVTARLNPPAVCFSQSLPRVALPQSLNNYKSTLSTVASRSF